MKVRRSEHFYLGNNKCVKNPDASDFYFSLYHLFLSARRVHW